MNPKTGEVAALVGGTDYTTSQFNRATQAIRQPGSTLSHSLCGIRTRIHACYALKKRIYCIHLSDGVSKYKPKNYKDYYADDFVTMAQALAVSDNIYAVKTNLFLGDDALAKTAKQFGIKSALKDVPSLALVHHQ
ncbi:penicillin-binding transpeptidase domain-containing protein [Bacillus thuringiensis]|uniref:penicillin-binding transpeptidase domain-containing protein n=1 Tax=Bacillus thuringiensis TaxID=1428 RepID=UPI0021DF82F8|nr:penicillin-binding transpeptidase domain-containing protein [Bacillus thuringiensis]UYC97406.1 penicillin-binding transpeptidase domain-containing protein [Bacillus thuringiensis]